MLLGIALANVGLYLHGTEMGPGLRPVDGSPLDRTLDFVVTLLVNDRSRPMFALLFGFGLVTMARRLGESGTEPRRRRSVLLRRQLLLNAFGGVHAALLFEGSDDPTALIATDTLSRNLEQGCATWIDVTGTTYDLPGVKPSHGFYQERRTSGSWQDAVNPYLETSEAIILGRPSTGIHPDVLTYWTNATNTTTSGRYTLYDRTCANLPAYRTQAALAWSMSTTEGVDAALAKVTTPCP